MRNQKLVVGVAVGAAVVAAGILFLRTRKGRQILSSLKDVAADAGEEIKTHWADWSEKASDSFRKGKELVRNTADKIKANHATDVMV